jgi:FAD/FMN-containing dehydrogenase
VDFYRLKQIKQIDKDALTVTVKAGVVFERLDKLQD